MNPLTVMSESSCSRTMSPGVLGPKSKQTLSELSVVVPTDRLNYGPVRNVRKLFTIGVVLLCAQSAELI